MNCPIKEDSEKLAKTSKDLVKAMRKLRRDILACDQCIAVDTCEIHARFRSLVNTAIREVVIEWRSSP
jgi:hypothetical protein